MEFAFNEIIMVVTSQQVYNYEIGNIQSIIMRSLWLTLYNTVNRTKQENNYFDAVS
jgi:hypothetical protein